MNRDLRINLIKLNQLLTTVEVEEMKRKITETEDFERIISWEQDPSTTVLDDSQRVEETDGEQLNRNRG